jgi:hypothetical protein
LLIEGSTESGPDGRLQHPTSPNIHRDVTAMNAGLTRSYTIETVNAFSRGSASYWQDPMINNDRASNELREHLSRVIEILRPYAQSHGPFHNPKDVQTAINLAGISLLRAERLASRLK